MQVKKYFLFFLCSHLVILDVTSDPIAKIAIAACHSKQAKYYLCWFECRGMGVGYVVNKV